MPTEVRKHVPLHFKKPLLVTGIFLARGFIIDRFVSFSGNKIDLFVLELGGKLYGGKSFRFEHKQNRIEQRNEKFHAFSFTQTVSQIDKFFDSLK